MMLKNQTEKHFIAKFAIITLLFCAIGFSSCKKEIINQEESLDQGTKVSRTADLKVSNTFKWSTINEMQVEISPNKAGLFMIQGSKAEVFHKAYLQPGVKHIARLSLPNVHENLFAYFNGAKEEIKVTAGIARTSLK